MSRVLEQLYTPLDQLWLAAIAWPNTPITSHNVSAIAVAPDIGIVAVGCVSGVLYLWQYIPEKLLFKKAPFVASISEWTGAASIIKCYFSRFPNPNLIGTNFTKIVVTHHSDGIFRLWAIDDGRCLIVLPSITCIGAPAFLSSILPNSRYIVCATQFCITVIDLWLQLPCVCCLLNSNELTEVTTPIGPKYERSGDPSSQTIRSTDILPLLTCLAKTHNQRRYSYDNNNSLNSFQSYAPSNYFETTSHYIWDNKPVPYMTPPGIFITGLYTNHETARIEDQNDSFENNCRMIITATLSNSRVLSWDITLHLMRWSQNFSFECFTPSITKPEPFLSSSPLITSTSFINPNSSKQQTPIGFNTTPYHPTSSPKSRLPALREDMIPPKTILLASPTTCILYPSFNSPIFPSLSQSPSGCPSCMNQLVVVDEDILGYVANKNQIIIYCESRKGALHLGNPSKKTLQLDTPIDNQSRSTTNLLNPHLSFINKRDILKSVREDDSQSEWHPFQHVFQLHLPDYDNETVSNTAQLQQDNVLTPSFIKSDEKLNINQENNNHVVSIPPIIPYNTVSLKQTTVDYLKLHTTLLKYTSHWIGIRLINHVHSSIWESLQTFRYISYPFETISNDHLFHLTDITEKRLSNTTSQRLRSTHNDYSQHKARHQFHSPNDSNKYDAKKKWCTLLVAFTNDGRIYIYNLSDWKLIIKQDHSNLNRLDQTTHVNQNTMHTLLPVYLTKLPAEFCPSLGSTHYLPRIIFSFNTQLQSSSVQQSNHNYTTVSPFTCCIIAVSRYYPDQLHFFRFDANYTSSHQLAWTFTNWDNTLRIQQIWDNPPPHPPCCLDLKCDPEHVSSDPLLKPSSIVTWTIGESAQGQLYYIFSHNDGTLVSYCIHSETSETSIYRCSPYTQLVHKGQLTTPNTVAHLCVKQDSPFLTHISPNNIIQTNSSEILNIPTFSTLDVNPNHHNTHLSKMILLPGIINDTPPFNPITNTSILSTTSISPVVSDSVFFSDSFNPCNRQDNQLLSVKNAHQTHCVDYPKDVTASSSGNEQHTHFIYYLKKHQVVRTLLKRAARRSFFVSDMGIHHIMISKHPIDISCSISDCTKHYSDSTVEHKQTTLIDDHLLVKTTPIFDEISQRRISNQSFVTSLLHQYHFLNYSCTFHIKKYQSIWDLNDYQTCQIFDCLKSDIKLLKTSTLWGLLLVSESNTVIQSNDPESVVTTYLSYFKPHLIHFNKQLSSEYISYITSYHYYTLHQLNVLMESQVNHDIHLLQHGIDQQDPKEHSMMYHQHIITALMTIGRHMIVGGSSQGDIFWWSLPDLSLEGVLPGLHVTSIYSFFRIINLHTSVGSHWDPYRIVSVDISGQMIVLDVYSSSTVTKLLTSPSEQLTPHISKRLKQFNKQYPFPMKTHTNSISGSHETAQHYTDKLHLFQQHHVSHAYRLDDHNIRHSKTYLTKNNRISSNIQPFPTILHSVHSLQKRHHNLTDHLPVSQLQDTSPTLSVFNKSSLKFEHTNKDMSQSMILNYDQAYDDTVIHCWTTSWSSNLSYRRQQGLKDTRLYSDLLDTLATGYQRIIRLPRHPQLHIHLIQKICLDVVSNTLLIYSNSHTIFLFNLTTDSIMSCIHLNVLCSHMIEWASHFFQTIQMNSLQKYSHLGGNQVMTSSLSTTLPHMNPLLNCTFNHSLFYQRMSWFLGLSHDEQHRLSTHSIPSQSNYHISIGRPYLVNHEMWDIFPHIFSGEMNGLFIGHLCIGQSHLATAPICQSNSDHSDMIDSSVFLSSDFPKTQYNNSLSSETETTSQQHQSMKSCVSSTINDNNQQFSVTQFVDEQQQCLSNQTQESIESNRLMDKRMWNIVVNNCLKQSSSAKNISVPCNLPILLIPFTRYLDYLLISHLQQPISPLPNNTSNPCRNNDTTDDGVIQCEFSHLNNDMKHPDNSKLTDETINQFITHKLLSMWNILGIFFPKSIFELFTALVPKDMSSQILQTMCHRINNTLPFFIAIVSASMAISIPIPHEIFDRIPAIHPLQLHYFNIYVKHPQTHQINESILNHFSLPLTIQPKPFGVLSSQSVSLKYGDVCHPCIVNHSPNSVAQSLHIKNSIVPFTTISTPLTISSLLNEMHVISETTIRPHTPQYIVASSQLIKRYKRRSRYYDHRQFEHLIAENDDRLVLHQSYSKLYHTRYLLDISPIRQKHKGLQSIYKQSYPTTSSFTSYPSTFKKPMFDKQSIRVYISPFSTKKIGLSTFQNTSYRSPSVNVHSNVLYPIQPHDQLISSVRLKDVPVKKSLLYDDNINCSKNHNVPRHIVSHHTLRTQSVIIPNIYSESSVSSDLSDDEILNVSDDVYRNKQQTVHLDSSNSLLLFCDQNKYNVNKTLIYSNNTSSEQYNEESLYTHEVESLQSTNPLIPVFKKNNKLIDVLQYHTLLQSPLLYSDSPHQLKHSWVYDKITPTPQLPIISSYLLVLYVLTFSLLMNHFGTFHYSPIPGLFDRTHITDTLRHLLRCIIKHKYKDLMAGSLSLWTMFTLHPHSIHIRDTAKFWLQIFSIESHLSGLHQIVREMTHRLTAAEKHRLSNTYCFNDTEKYVYKQYSMSLDNLFYKQLLPQFNCLTFESYPETMMTDQIVSVILLSEIAFRRPNSLKGLLNSRHPEPVTLLLARHLLNLTGAGNDTNTMLKEPISPTIIYYFLELFAQAYRLLWKKALFGTAVSESMFEWKLWSLDIAIQSAAADIILDKKNNSLTASSVSGGNASTMHLLSTTSITTKKQIKQDMTYCMDTGQISSSKITLIHQLIFRIFYMLQKPLYSYPAMMVLLEIGRTDTLRLIRAMGFAARRLDQGANFSNSSILLIVRLFVKYPVVCLRYLSQIVDSIVKCLDPSNPSLRRSALTSATSALFQLVRVFPMITFHQETQRFAIGNFDGFVVIYDLRTATKWRVLDAHSGPVSVLGFTHDGTQIASYCVTDQMFCLWQCSSSGFLGGILGISGKCQKLLRLPRPANRKVLPIAEQLKTMRLAFKSKNDWILKREDGKGYAIRV